MDPKHPNDSTTVRWAHKERRWDGFVRRCLLVMAAFVVGVIITPLEQRVSRLEVSSETVNPVDASSAQKQFQWSHISPTEYLEYHDCFDGLQCTRLKVPMDHKRVDGKGRTVAIAVARLPAKVPVTDPRYGGAVLINPGGPGGSGIAQILASGRNFQTIVDSETDPGVNYDEALSSSAKYFDIIGFDPRGVNNTTPGINCFPDVFSRRNWELQLEADGMLGSSSDSLMRNWQRNRALAPSCSERILAANDGKEVLGEHVNTSPVVEDMVMIIERHGEWREKQGIALQKLHDSQNGHDKLQTLVRRTQWKKGSEKLLYWGRSYGTILGATFAAMHPHRVERSVLDGVVDIDHYYHTRGSSNVVDADAIFDRFAIYCDAAGSEKCGMYTPGGPDAVKKATLELLSEVRNSSVPVMASVTRGPEVVTWTDLMTIVRYALYQPLYFFPVFAEVLGDLRRGDGSTMANFKQQSRVPSCVSAECRRAGAYSRECTLPPAEEATSAILCTDAEKLRTFDLDGFHESWQSLKNESGMLGDYWAQLALSCVGWKAEAKWRFTGPLYTITDHPLLFVSNTLDPVTPLRSAYKTSSFFPLSVVLEQESEGHTSLAAPSLCTAKSIRAYFQTGVLPHPGLLCPADSKPLLGRSSSSSSEVKSAGDITLQTAVEDEVRKHKNAGQFLPL